MTSPLSIANRLAQYGIIALLLISSFGLVTRLFASVPSGTARTCAAETPRKCATDIAKQALLMNAVSVASPSGPRRYLLAGGHQLRSLWTRDLAFSVQGALSTGLEGAVRDSLEQVYLGQRADGLLPRVLDNYPVQTRVLTGLLGLSLPFQTPLRAWFDTEHGVIALDSNALIPWASAQYIARTGDRAFALKWYESASRSIKFLKEHYWENGLIAHQPPYADWEDSVRRTERVSYTNVVYVMALRGLSSWAGIVGERDAEVSYALEADQHSEALRRHFWDVGLGALNNFDGDRTLTADSNLLAVVYDVLSPQEARTTLSTLEASPLWQPFPGRPTFPNFKSELKAITAKAAGIIGYHDDHHWLWISALAARAAAKIGDCTEYGRIMEALERQITHDGGVSEILTRKRDGSLSPQHGLRYQAERPFTWSAAMYLEARDQPNCAR